MYKDMMDTIGMVNAADPELGAAMERELTRHPLLYVSTPGKYPMSLFVKLSMDGDTGFAWNKILALSLISILPQLIVFFCAQDQFVEGISAGAVKG